MQWGAKTPSTNKEDENVYSRERKYLCDEAIEVDVVSQWQACYRRNRGWIWMTFANSLVKINDSSNLLDSIRRINVDETKEKI
jgi:hypothetical protein